MLKTSDILLETVGFLCALDLYVSLTQPLSGMNVIFSGCRFCIHSLGTRMATLTGYASFYALSAVLVGDCATLLFYSAADHNANV